MIKLFSLSVIISIVGATSKLPVIVDPPPHCHYKTVLGGWTFYVGKKYSDLKAFASSALCDNFKTVDKVEIKLSYPDVAHDNKGNVGTWTMVYDKGFDVVINNRRYTSMLRINCTKTLPSWSNDMQVRQWACYNGVKTKGVAFVKGINLDQTLESNMLTPPRIPKPLDESQKNELAALPKNFDWRNVSGKNFVSPVRSQGWCGSCYAFAATAMLESRIRITSKNKKKPILSPQNIVDCSRYSLGCNSGLAYMAAGPYLEDFGVVEESCVPYKAKMQSCSNIELKCKRWYGKNYRYIGGYYGGCTADLMKLEIYKNGPIAVTLHSFGSSANFRYPKNATPVPFDPFESAVHFVAIVGYGVNSTTGKKYWIVKNSWGTVFGDKGYVNVERGTNALGIENSAVVTHAVL